MGYVFIYTEGDTLKMRKVRKSDRNHTNFKNRRLDDVRIFTTRGQY